PDVTARFDTITVDEVGPDRVRISGVRGEAPPDTLKVAMNELGGHRNQVSVALTGLDIEA
ncbi:MAG TPA: exopolyphosphatase, partial [Acidimicrobiaceae bacterium]|nr:exopolyphosphatase [Acidimicrobiaceae bacterium]